MIFEIFSRIYFSDFPDFFSKHFFEGITGEFIFTNYPLRKMSICKVSWMITTDPFPPKVL